MCVLASLDGCVRVCVCVCVCMLQVLDRVCQVANWLRSEGVQKGDAVTIYMPMVRVFSPCMVHPSVHAAYTANHAQGHASPSAAANVIRSAIRTVVCVCVCLSVCVCFTQVCELPIAMLACARIGAVHSVVFGGFSADSLAQRIMDCQGSVLITATGAVRGTKPIMLKQIVDKACATVAASGTPVSAHPQP